MRISSPFPRCGLSAGSPRSISSADAESGARRLEQKLDVLAAQATADLLHVHAARSKRAQREKKVVARFTAAHPQVPTVSVPALAGDVHDLAGLREIGDLLGG